MSRDTDQYDFFVSYARADNRQGWISRFIQELLAEHARFFPDRQLRYFLDEQDVLGFDDWQLRIHHALAQSRLLVSFISPAYFVSEWCRREWRAWIDSEIAKHILSQGAAPIYFVEVPGFVAKVPGLRQQDVLGEQEVARQVAELCGLTPPHDDFIASAAPIVHQIRSRRQVTKDFVRPFADEGIDAIHREDLRRILADLARDLDKRIGCVRDAARSETTVPPYNKRFSGRFDELLELRRRLKDDQAGVICGVHGLGGIGKTELAFTYAHAFAAAYPGGRFLVPCESKSNLRDAVLCLGDFPEIRARIADDERKTPETYFAAISRCLHERLAAKGHILLVLDNVTDTTLVGPQQTDVVTALGPKLHLLATTRGLPPAGGHWLTLGELPECDALDLLEKHRLFANDAERDAARRIVKRLGGFTLAVELVAAWVAVHSGTTYANLVEGLGLEDLEIEMAGDRTVELRRHDHERRLGAVLGPVMMGLTPAQRRVLEYAALLPPDHVALPWLRELLQHDFPEELRPRRLVADPWRELWDRLIRLALFMRVEGETSEPKLVRVHRLMQDLLRRELGAEALAERQGAVDKLAQARAAALAQTTRWEEASWELEPFEALADLWAESGHAGAAWSLNQAACQWHCLAEWTRAEALMRRGLAIGEQSYGPNHPTVATARNNLAQLLKDTNRLAEAEPLMRRALAIDEQSYGSDHPEVATDLNNLAQLLKDTNRLAEAKPLMARVVAIFERSLGADHPKVATALNNLSLLLLDTNRLAEAEPLMRRALAIDEQSYGPNHPKVAIRLNNLTQLLQNTNRLAEAELLMRRALAIDEDSYGPDHPDVAIHLNNLAQLLDDTNRLEEAEPLMRRALTIDERSYGPDHPAVARDLNNLAALLKVTNRLAEAEPMMRRALAIDERSFGADHPKVAIRLNNLAQLLKDTNRLAEAEPLMRRALAIDEQSYGPDHPAVARDLNNLSLLLQDTNRLAEAEPLMRRALAIDEQSYGSDHPEVATDLNNLAQLLKDTNRLAEAKPLMRRALTIDEQSYGPDHPTVARDLNILAQLLLATNRLAEAEPLSRRHLVILLEFTRATGHPHSHLQSGVANYAGLLKAMGRSGQEVTAELNALVTPFGIQFGD